MTGVSQLSDAKILVVDDQPNAVNSLVALLRLAGYANVSSTTDPTLVRHLYAEYDFDLILLDLVMPAADGISVMADLRAVEKHGYLPVMAITGWPGQKVDALRAGARDFVEKPFDNVELQLRVRNMVEIRLLHKAAVLEGELNRSLAMYDALTGLPNRRLLVDRIATATSRARRDQRMFSVMYLDLDGFKGINDTYGHGAGDTLLKTAASRLKAVTRETDTVARISGDEFVVLLNSVNLISDAETAASKLLHALSQPYEVANCSVSVTASIGVSFFPHHGQNVATLLGSADEALWAAKRSGKNRWHMASGGRDDFHSGGDVISPVSRDPSRQV